METLTVNRKPWQDATALAAMMARIHGTRLTGTLQWCARSRLVCQDATTADGRKIRVVEPPNKQE